VAPEAVEAAMSLVVRWVLPRPSGSRGGDEGAYSRDLDLGWWAALFPTQAARRLNQPAAIGETR
jgi:hypothetical protein